MAYPCLKFSLQCSQSDPTAEPLMPDLTDFPHPGQLLSKQSADERNLGMKYNDI